MAVDAMVRTIGCPQASRGALCSADVGRRLGRGITNETIHPQVVRVAMQRRSAVVLAP